MRPTDIDRFFTLLSKRIPFTIQVILTGGGAGILEGVERVTRDLDFQVTFKGRSPRHAEVFQEAIEGVAKETGIAAQYDSDIESWSSISWPKAGAKSRLYRRFGKIEVRILDPLWWSIGKLARYLSSDIADLLVVLKTTRTKPTEAVKAWGNALGRSPTSSAQPIFKRQVLNFLEVNAKTLWGPKADPAQLSDLFLATARKTLRSR